MAASTINPVDLESFQSVLRYSDRVLALCGAGLSAASGLPTFRGAGGIWRSHAAVQLATPEAFRENPGLVWHFYNYRRHMALDAKPNAAHYALAELARRKKGFLTLTQNVDALSPRAGHDARKIKYLHGSLFDLKCSAFFCNYKETNNFVDPLVPALEIPKEVPQPTPSGTAGSSEAATASLEKALGITSQDMDISKSEVPLRDVSADELPHCPECGNGMLRPGIVWFGEQLPSDTLSEVDRFVAESPKIDIMLVIGTSAAVYPAAGYVAIARDKGARVAVINMDRNDIPGGQYGMCRGDWFFPGDASTIVPELFKGEIGDIGPIMERQMGRAEAE